MPATSIATPPPAPSAPAEKTSSAPAAEQSTQPASHEESPPGEFFQELKSWQHEEFKAPAKPAEKPAEEAPETPQETPEEPEAAKTPAEPEKLAVAKTANTPKALREQYEKATAEIKAYQKKTSDLEAKMADYEARGKDTTALAEQLATREKEIADMRAEMAALKHETSPEFKAKYDKPFDQAAAYAKQTIEQIRTVNPETGEQDGRMGTMTDFAAIYNMPYADAKVAAKKAFGEDASVIMEHYQQLHRLNYERETALGEEKKSWETKLKEREANQAKEKEFFTSAIQTAIKGLVESDPKLYGLSPKGEDDEGNILVANEFAAMSTPGKTPQEEAVRLAALQMRAAIQPRETKRRMALEAKVAELEGIIAKMKGQGPAKGGKPTSGTVKTPEMGFIEAARSELA